MAKTSSDNKTERFDVALSFAGEDRPYVEKTAAVLRRMGLRVFYDKYEQISLWGKNLYDHLSEVYGDSSRYTVVFISKYYARKLWTNHERQAAQARAFSERREYILPARFDATKIPGVHETIGYIGLAGISPEKFAHLIKEKIGPIRRHHFMPPEPDLFLAELGVKRKRERNTATIVVNDLFQQLCLMTPEERHLLATVAFNTCPTGPLIDNDIHINIGVLSRMLKVDRRHILGVCSRLECLHIDHRMTAPGPGSPKDTLRITYEPMFVDDELRGNWTKILVAVFECLGKMLCPNCIAGAIDRVDLSPLSSLAHFPEPHHAQQKHKSGRQRPRRLTEAKLKAPHEAAQLTP